MEPRYSLAHLTALQCPPPELIYIASRAGYDAVSLRTIPLGLDGEPNYQLSRDASLLKLTEAALRSTGLRLNDIELTRIYPGLEPRDYAGDFETAARLGARDVICSIWSADRAFYVDKFTELCQLARQFDLRVNLEYVVLAEVRSLEQAVDVLRSSNAANAGLLLDMYHLFRGGIDLEQLRHLPTSWFNLCQLCDAPADSPPTSQDLREEVRERRLYLGEGAIDVASVLACVPEMVYALEIPNHDRIAEYGYMEHAVRALESSKAYFASHSLSPAQ